MVEKTIFFTVKSDGSVSPATEQKAGVQGSHNVVNVMFDVSELALSESHRVRVQFIDGAGGFYSTGFLETENILEKLCVNVPVPDDVTNAGGLANAYLVVSEITYSGEDEPAIENQVFMSNGGKLRFTHSGVGSPSEYAYRVGISNALVNAEIFAGRAKSASNTAKEHRDKAEEFKIEAGQSASLAAETKTEIEFLKIQTSSYAETALGASQAATNAKDEVIEAKRNAEAAARVSEQSATDAAAKLEELKNELKDIEPALDAIIDIQNSFLLPSAEGTTF